MEPWEAQTRGDGAVTHRLSPRCPLRACEEDSQQSREQSLTKALRCQGRRRSRPVALGGEAGKCPGLHLRVLPWIQTKDCYHRGRGGQLSCPGLLEALQSGAAAGRPDSPQMCVCGNLAAATCLSAPAPLQIRPRASG